MSKIETVRGILKTFFWLTKEELDIMDHKLLRIGFGIITFAAVTLLWYFIFSKIAPF